MAWTVGMGFAKLLAMSRPVFAIIFGEGSHAQNVNLLAKTVT